VSEEEEETVVSYVLLPSSSSSPLCTALHSLSVHMVTRSVLCYTELGDGDAVKFAEALQANTHLKELK
jgi:hypothetical protein